MHQNVSQDFGHVGSRIQSKAACKDDLAPQAIRKSQCHGILMIATAPFALLGVGRFVTCNANLAEFLAVHCTNWQIRLASLQTEVWHGQPV